MKLEVEKDEKKIHKETKSVPIEKNQRKKIRPTILGQTVNKFLSTNFSFLLDYEYTCRLNKMLDEVSTGEKVWNVVISKANNDFEDDVKKLNQVEWVLTKPLKIGEWCEKWIYSKDMSSYNLIQKLNQRLEKKIKGSKKDKKLDLEKLGSCLSILIF